MSAVHDMGGRHGDGPVPERDDAQVFHSDWEARALAITVLSGAIGKWSIDAGRLAREALGPEDYPRFSYYEKWMAALADIAVARGVLTREELAAVAEGQSLPTAPRMDKALDAADVLASQRRVVPYTRDEGPSPLFAVGAQVRTAETSPNPGGHTRLPGYAMGKVGRVVAIRGNHVFPDSNAHFNGEAPEPLYTVAFAAGSLWPDEGRAGDEVMIDLWQSYLSAAQ